MTKTRFPELSYLKIQPTLWRVVDNNTGRCIGPFYKTEKELLADLDRFASVFGCN